jgi:hypothetical protein
VTFISLDIRDEMDFLRGRHATQRGLVVGSGLLVASPCDAFFSFDSGGGAGAPLGNSINGISLLCEHPTKPIKARLVSKIRMFSLWLHAQTSIRKCLYKHVLGFISRHDTVALISFYKKSGIFSSKCLFTILVQRFIC